MQDVKALVPKLFQAPIFKLAFEETFIMTQKSIVIIFSKYLVIVNRVRNFDIDYLAYIG